MQKQLIEHMRAHAHALVKIARKLTDPAVSQELEALATDLLKHAHLFERDTRRSSMNGESFGAEPRLET
jgi:hypothetical protein